jgi:hypothetical protein
MEENVFKFEFENMEMPKENTEIVTINQIPLIPDDAKVKKSIALRS